MNRSRSLVVSLAVVLAGAVACTTVPYTQRSQMLFTSEAQEMALGAEAYQHVLAEEKVVTDARIIAPVREVGQQIAAAANKPEYAWEFNVIDEPNVANAAVLPGGKVIVYSGLFPVARDTGGLAAVLAHEVAHAIARHGGERMSQGTLLQALGFGLSVAFDGASPQTQQAVLAAFGLGSQVGVVLPFGRAQESEADQIGMILMAQAGYDPVAALELWQRMEAQAGAGSAPPEWLSTHPSHTTRQENIRKWLPEARSHFRADAAVRVKPLPSVR